MTCAVSAAVREGAEAVICASTGNTAASAAAYAARAGLRGAVIVPEGKIATGKLAQALDARRARDRAARQLRPGARARARARRRATRSRSSTRSTSSASRARRPRRSRSLEELDGELDALCIPVGNAGNITAYWRGFQRARRRARGCSASRPRARRRSCAAQPVEHPETVASAIRIGNPARWEEAMDAMTASRRRDPRRHRRRRSSPPTACSRRARASSASRPRPPRSPGCSSTAPAARERIVCVLTGHGLKDPQTALDQPARVVPCEPELAARRARRCWAESERAPRSSACPPRSANLGPGFDCSPPRSRCTSRSRCARPARSRSRPTSPSPRDRAQPRRARPSSAAPRRRLHVPRSARDIPLGGGLGSSAAAIVAGLLAADHLFELDADVLALATRARGPSRQRRRRAARRLRRLRRRPGRALRRRPPGSRRCSSCRTTPVRTPRRARALPAEVPLADAVFNVAHGALLMLGLARGDWDLVARGLARPSAPAPPRPPVPALAGAGRARARELGALGATISGAGPTVLVWCHYEQTGAVRRGAAPRGRRLGAP